MLGGVALNGCSQDAARLFLTGGFQLVFVFLDAVGDLIGQFFSHPLQQQRLGLVPAEAGNFVQFLRLLLEQGLQLLAALVHQFAAFVQLALGVLERPLFLEQDLMFLIQGVFAFF